MGLETNDYKFVRASLTIVPSFRNDGSVGIGLAWWDHLCFYETMTSIRGGESQESLLQELSKFSGNGDCATRRFHFDLVNDLIDLCGSDGHIISAKSVLNAKSELTTRWNLRALRANMILAGVTSFTRDEVISVLDECLVIHLMNE